MKRRNKHVKALEELEETKAERIHYTEKENICISCGAIIPEGSLVCFNCQKGLTASYCVVCNKPLGNGNFVCPHCGNMLLQNFK